MLAVLASVWASACEPQAALQDARRRDQFKNLADVEVARGCNDRLRPVAGCGRSAVSTRGAMSGSYSVAELDRIISDIFSFTKGGSASKAILPEPEVCKLCDMAKEILQVRSLDSGV